MLADGGEAIAIWRCCVTSRGLFGPVASDPTAWRVLDAHRRRGAGPGAGGSGAARELAWAQLAETRRRLPASIVAGSPAARVGAGHRRDDRDLPLGEGIGGPDVEETRSAITRCCVSSTPPAKPWPGCCAPGNAGSNTAADHITVLDQALAQIPDAHRYGSPILIRSDSAGSSHAFLAHIRGLREHGVHT